MEEELKQLLGDQYHEGMTAQEVKTFFEKGVLSTGKYTNKDASDATIKKLQQDLAAKDNLLKSKMSDDEKAKADREKELAEFEELKKQLQQSKIDGNKFQAMSIVANAREQADVKADDKDFNEFMAAISNEDLERTTKVSNYLAKLVSSAYEKGKADATKKQMAKMGSFKTGGSSDDGENARVKYAQELAKKNSNKVVDNPYFK